MVNLYNKNTADISTSEAADELNVLADDAHRQQQDIDRYDALDFSDDGEVLDLESPVLDRLLEAGGSKAILEIIYFNLQEFQ